MIKKVFVRGPALSRSGYGEQCRFALRALRQFPDQFDIYLENTVWGETGWLWEDNEERRWIDHLINRTFLYAQESNGNPQFDVSLQVTIPNEFQPFAPVNIGYTAGIETTKLPADWMPGAMGMNRMIVVSNHAKYAFEHTEHQLQDQHGRPVKGKVTCPIDVVNYCTTNVKAKEIDLDLKHNFNFLVVAQWSPRKNLDNTIKWFVEQFSDEEVGLVLKVSWRKSNVMDRRFTETVLNNILSAYPDRKCSVHLLHGDMTEEEMAGLYSHPKIKCLINLAHGEGFGLPMFEAIQHELPVMCPAWGGQNDFIYMKKKVKDRRGKKVTFKEKNVCMVSSVEYDVKAVEPHQVSQFIIPESQWCFPTQWRFKLRLKEMIKNYSKFKSRAKELAAHIKENFTPEKQYRLFAESVFGEALPQKVEVKKEDIPKVSIITSMFNSADYVDGFLESIENQTVWDKCELVVVSANKEEGEDDKKVLQFLEKYPEQVKYVRLTDEDPGIYGCWNLAVDLADGEFITNSNLDDRRAPHSIETLASHMVADQVDFVYADSFISRTANETYEDFMKKPKKDRRQYSFPQASVDAFLKGNQAHHNPMWKKELHDRVGMFDENLKSAGDWEFNLRCITDGAKFKKVNDVLAVYYFNPSGVSTDPKNAKWKIKEEQGVLKKYLKKTQEESVQKQVDKQMQVMHHQV